MASASQTAPAAAETTGEEKDVVMFALIFALLWNAWVVSILWEWPQALAWPVLAGLSIWLLAVAAGEASAR